MRCLVALFCCASLLHAAQTPIPTKEAVAQLIAQGSAYLLSQRQGDGSFWMMPKFKLGITAVAVEALSSSPGLATDDPRVRQGYELLKRYQQPDGGIYEPSEGYANYVTSLTLMAAARLGETDRGFIERAQNYLLGIQNQDENSIFYGGIGYGSRGAGAEDLNNTTYAVLALRETGLSADHPAMQRALAFLRRCQNLSGEGAVKWAGSDGGAFYSPDESKVSSQRLTPEDIAADAVQTAAGRLNSYGSMTYNLISGYIALDLQADDPRLQAALRWVGNHYVFDRNPGMSKGQEQQGLYYFLLMMGKTLGTIGHPTLLTAEGDRDWRSDLFAAIQASAQPTELPDGSTAMTWVNAADRWAEGVPVLVTAYMVRALKHIHNAL